ncbi:MAG: type VI secretion system membrane subunit TssM [Helicobacteraceae bacterium]|nr:type VI secretion system membrane subunit TssM [Helicobacteraceae bacterium]
MTNLFRSAIFWLIVISLVFLTLVVFVGDYFFVFFQPLAMRLLVGFGQFFLILIGILLYMLYMKEQIQAALKKILEKRKDERERQKIIKEKTQLLKQRFAAALKTIKNSSVYKRERTAKYELPWYLLVGAESEGKTTLLESSGLSFPLNIDYAKRSVKEEGSTQSFNWYFAEHAVFIDVPGAYISQSEDGDSADSVVWGAFLNLFRRWRRRRPINGVILTVSAETLTTKNNKEIEKLAKDLRDRFDEIRDAFMAVIPIYLLVTKSDTIMGFKEYFATLSEEEIDEALGVTFEDRESIDSYAARGEFDALTARLSDSVIERMHKEWESENRSKILLFCNEFSALFRRLEIFIDNGFAKTRYRKPLLLRGIYFTSVPEASDRPIVYGGDMLPSSVRAEGLFIHKLLTEIIFPESDIVKMDSSHKKRFIASQIAATVFWLLFVLSVIGYWARDYKHNLNVEENIKNSFAEYRKNRDLVFGKVNSADSANLLDKLYAIYKYDDRQYIWETAFLKTIERQKALEKLYYSTLEKVLLPKAAKYAERQIKGNLDKYEILWENTKAYIMLNEVERRDAKFLREWAGAGWSKAGIIEHWNRLIEKGFDSYEIDKNSLQSARKALSALGRENLIYREMKNIVSSDPRTKDFRFLSATSAYPSVFDDESYAIPGFFTKNGYEKILLLNGKQMIRNIIKDNWVVAEQTDISKEELDQLYLKIEGLYFNEYAQHWTLALNKLKVRSTARLADITMQYSAFTAADSPILTILREAKNNTQIYTPLETAQKHLAKKGGAIGGAIPTNNIGGEEERITSQFRAKFNEIHILLDDESQPSNTLKAAIKSVEDEYREIAGMQPEEGFKLAVGRTKGVKSPIIAANLLSPSKAKDWFAQAHQNNWGYVVSLAKDHISEQYNTQVYEFYLERLRGKYPIDKGSSIDAGLSEFEEFFKKGGILDSFSEQYVSPFVKFDYKNGKYNFNNIDGSRLDFEDRFLRSLIAADRIKKSYFDPKGSTLAVTVRVKPFELGEDISIATMQYDNGVLDFDTGHSYEKQIIWPSSSDSRSELAIYDASSHTLTNSNRVLFFSHQGDWSLFRTLGEFSELSNKGASLVRLTWRVNKSKAKFVTFEISGNAASFFDKDKKKPLLNFNLTEKL